MFAYFAHYCFSLLTFDTSFLLLLFYFDRSIIFQVPPPSSLGWTSVRSVYEAGGSSSKDVKYTVPILWDLSTSTIVNNESSEIIRMLYDTSLLGKFATKNQTLQLLPSALTQHINETNEWVYTHINNGVYKCGFANTQQAYMPNLEIRWSTGTVQVTCSDI